MDKISNESKLLLYLRYMMSKLSQNLKVLIWKYKKELKKMTYNEYIDFVAQKVSISLESFRDILMDRKNATDDEVLRLAEFFDSNDYYLNILKDSSLMDNLKAEEKDEIMTENLKYLYNLVPHGEKNRFAEYLGVHISNVERWVNTGQKPQLKAREKIKEYFQLSKSEDLENDLLFLGIEPVGLAQKRYVCKELIDKIDKDEFNKIYPALIKLLK